MQDARYILLLRKAGFRATMPRLAILKALSQSKYPLSVEDVAHTLRAKHIDTATIYRTLEAFARTQLAREVNLRRGKAYYELSKREDHHHLVCVECGKVRDIAGCAYPAQVQQATKFKRGFSRIIGHSFEIFGVCKPCAVTVQPL